MRLDMSAKKIQKESGRGKAKESECAEAKLLPRNASNRYQQKIKIGTSLQEKKILKIKSCPCEIVYYCYRTRQTGP